MVDQIVETLEKAFANKQGRNQDYYIKTGREALRQEGFEPNPVGVGNRKTELPGTYRPVGASCPKTCALLGEGCYAQKGRVNMVQVRAEVNLAKDLSSAGLAMATAANMAKPGPARLHVSGDLLKNGELDQDYIDGLVEMAPKVSSESPVKAYGYTHAKGEEARKAISRLKSAGIVIRQSLDDKPAPGGAFVAEKNFSNFIELKMANPGVPMAKCREQVDGTSCANCGICYEEKYDKVCVIFAKH